MAVALALFGLLALEFYIGIIENIHRQPTIQAAVGIQGVRCD
jgi:hypothetical protein